MAVWEYRGRRGAVWRYKFDLRGRTYRGTFRVRNRREADEQETKLRAEILAGRYRPAQRSPRLADFIREQYLPWARLHKASAYDDGRIVPLVEEFFGPVRLGEITPKLCRRFQQWLLERPTVRARARRPATVNRQFNVLSRMLRLAVEQELLEANPCTGISRLRPDDHVIRSLGREEEARLMEYLTAEREHLRPLVVVLLHTGMRLGELLSLRRWQVDLEQNRVNLEKTKSRRVRTVPLNSVARAELERACRGIASDALVFPNPETGEQWRNIRGGFQKACELSGVPKFRIHDLRHTFGTRMAEAGVPIHRIAAMMGHANIQTTMRYVHASAQGLHEAVELLVTGRPAQGREERAEDEEKNRRKIVAKSETGQGAGSPNA
ncbi:MAG: tyrosine-type recombinase/integrase [Blastocatellia bacterium]